MALVLDIQPYENTRLGVWRIDEPAGFFFSNLKLSIAEQSLLTTLLPAKKLEWLASRYVLDQIMDHPDRVDTNVLPSGKPILIGRDEEISLSHTDNHVAAMIGKTSVGIDIQRCKHKILQVEHKFASAAESALIDRSQPVLHLHILWGAKEALYKIYSKKQLNFISQIFVNLPAQIQENGDFSGVVKVSGDELNCRLSYHILDNYVLVYGQINS
jgi:4'-phosphopantetheinyl transferase EntD